LRFPVADALSPLVAAGLRRARHDAAHLRDDGMSAAGDEEVLARAGAEDRILVSADTEFAHCRQLTREILHGQHQSGSRSAARWTFSQAA
jgi:predicted nuclease of predicted toxin-antitoxin system